jgi:outer membrane protein assembly factor BamB
VTAADAKSGETLWEFDLNEATGSAEVHGTMLILGDTLYVPTDSPAGGYVFALDARNGTERWRATTELAGASGGFITDLVNAFDSIVTVTSHHELVSLDFETGKVRWVRKLGGSGERRLSAALYKRRIYLTDGTDLLVVDPKNGNELARYPMGAAATTSVAVIEDAVYVGLQPDRLAAFAIHNGRLAKSIALPHRAVWTPRSIDSTVLVLTLGDELVATGLDLEKILWRRGTEGEWNSPRIERWEQYALVGDDHGMVAAIDPKSGEIVRRFEVKGTVRGIGVTQDVLYIGTLRGDVFAYSTDAN